MAFAAASAGHGGVSVRPDSQRAIVFPDTADHVTLVADLHTHSVFSDGHVWPYIRVAEAVLDGLDALAITEHLEYQPHRRLLPNRDRNSAVNEARIAALPTRLIVINGSEITRDAPAGHMNAVFLDDANELLPVAEDEEIASWPVEEAVAAANRQGAFVFWNHPWGSPATPDLRTELTEFHADLIAKGQLHGIEIVNGPTYSEEAHRIALEHDLALIGTSDVHNLIDWDYDITGGGHRPVTLVLADDRTPEALRSALFERRTVVWYRDLLIGRAAHLDELLETGLTLDDVRRHPSRDLVQVELVNRMESPMRLRHLTTDRQSFVSHGNLIDVEPHGRILLTLRPAGKHDEARLEFEVLNALVAPNAHPQVVLTAALPPRLEDQTEYRHPGEPVFSIDFPLGTRSIARDALEQVFAASTPDGVTFQAAVMPIPDGVSLEGMAGHYASRLETTGIGSGIDVVENRNIALADGTPAVRSVIRWLYVPAGVSLATQAVFAYRGENVVFVTAHPRAESAGVGTVGPIVESLRFD